MLAFRVFFLLLIPSGIIEAAVLDRVIVRPTGRLHPSDVIQLEIRALTSYAPAYLSQPAQVQITGNEILVRVYVASGNSAMPDDITFSVELGSFNSGSYSFRVDQAPNLFVTGTFCVDDPACQSPSCTCPVFTPTYEIIDLGGLHSFAHGINEAGQVAGRSYGAPLPQHAVRWTDGVMEDLPLRHPNDSQSIARDLNDAGDVVGNSGGYATLWRNGQVITITTGAGSAYAVNDLGQVAGVMGPDSQPYHGFLWQDGVLTDLTTTYGMPRIYDINNAGEMVGVDKLLLADGTVIELGDLGGGGTGAEGINDARQVVGSSRRAGEPYTAHGFLWQDGTMTDLSAALGFQRSSAAAISNLGHILGHGMGDGGAYHAFIYHPSSGVRLLRDLLPIDTGWLNLRVVDVNSRGEIAGYGMTAEGQRVFLLRPLTPPIPAASSWSMAILALLILIAATIAMPRTTGSRS